MIRAALALAIPLVACCFCYGGDRPNVLFIAIDDLRSDLRCLGVSYAVTPNLDALAGSGRLFTRHYVQVPTCGASRCALLRGRYPSEPAQLGNTAIRDTQRQWVESSLPGWFRRHGYQTMALGKITHYPGGRTGRHWNEGAEELAGVWDRCWIPESPWKTAEAMMHGYANGKARTRGTTAPWEAFEGPDTAYPDAWVADEAIATLDQLGKSNEQWFFAVGFFKPHLPFAAPRKYFELHDPSNIPVPPVSERPEEPSGWHRSGEFRGNYGHQGRDPATDVEYARLIRHAYAAATTYVDAQVGRVLQALREAGLEDNTIIVVWSDHGFLLGEHAIWGKHCLYELSVRSPLIIKQPEMLRPGEPTQAIVETVDLFPTLVDLCGLPQPKGFDGRSLRPQLEAPHTASNRPAQSFWTGGQRAIRTEQWRLIVHPQESTPEGKPDAELFDMQRDPHESTNIAAQYPEVVRRLLAEVGDQ